MNAITVVKQIFEDPGMDDSLANLILWSCTGWPTWWTGDPVRCFVGQLRHAKRSLARGFTIDDIFEGKDDLLPSRTC